MKRQDHLYPQILAWENLRLAAWKAQRGKAGRRDAQDYMAHLDERLTQLHGWLVSGELPVQRPRQFTIHDPKTRTITAPTFPQRVLHHAIMNVVEPVLERHAIHHSYACRRGKGQFAAIAAAQQAARRHGWYLKLDVRHYFDSIHKEVLLELLSRCLAEERLLGLLRQIVCGFQPMCATGLPIGSLISQHLANFYLGQLDHQVLGQRRCAAYVRYMDDSVLWADGRAALVEAEAWLHGEALELLRLELKPGILQRSDAGLSFLGHRVWPGRIDLNRSSKLRYARKMKALHGAWLRGDVGEAEAQQRATCLAAFTQHADCLGYRRSLAAQWAEG